MRYLAIAALVACSNDPKPSLQSGSAASISQTRRGGSAGGFAAGMAGDLAKGTTGAAVPTAPAPGAPAPSAPAPGEASGFRLQASASGSAADPSPSPTLTSLSTPTPTSTTSTSTSTSSSPAPVVAPGSGAAAPSAHRAYVKPPPDVAAIKLDLEPNWDRDFDEAGTISFVLKVPSSNDSRVFVFHYGHDEASAPASCEDYKKWLIDGKRLNVTLDRQRGGACYFEGTDDKNVPVFRFHVTFGGRPLICGGPQYKDAASNQLGDLRDKVVAAAKQICQTLAL